MGVFVTTEELKNRCRMSKTADDETLAILTEAERETSAWMIGILGQTRYAQLITYASVYPPTTDANVQRINAEQAETMYIYSILLQRLPSFFLAAQSQSRMAFNDNAAGRKNTDELTEMVALYESKASTLATSLIVADEEEAEIDDEQTRSAAQIGPVTPNSYGLFNSIGRELDTGYFW